LPQKSSEPTTSWEATVPGLALLRLHGHNRETWAKKGLASAAERFNYLYLEDELRTLAGPVKALTGRARRVHVLFNNCHGDKAQRNATQFRKLVG
jgi:uncharacterized protein YecE (DUF72 family)